MEINCITKKKMASINLNMCNYNKCVWAKFTF